MDASEKLFREYFLPLYPPDARADLARARATDANPANNPSIVAHLDDAARVFVARAPALFGEDLALDFGDASVHRLSARLGPERRDAWARAGAAGSPDNELFNVVVHGSAYVGACIVRAHGGAWSVRRPLWESLVVLRSRAGEASLAVFHWWLKSLAALGTEGATLADRYRTYVEIPCARPEELPVIAPPDRALPRLARPRYDLLVKYIKAHLPELRDLGEHFPSPERFAAYGLRWLDFFLVGGGRMLVMAGPGAEALHVFWMDASGFAKGATLPADASPEPIVRVEGEKIVIATTVAGAPLAHEMLWWGP
jgi:hypothetical protein